VYLSTVFTYVSSQLNFGLICHTARLRCMRCSLFSFSHFLILLITGLVPSFLDPKFYFMSMFTHAGRGTIDTSNGNKEQAPAYRFDWPTTIEYSPGPPTYHIGSYAKRNRNEGVDEDKVLFNSVDLSQ
jgi:hypothetical protein